MSVMSSLAPAGWRLGPLPTPGTREVPAQCVVVIKIGDRDSRRNEAAQEEDQVGFCMNGAFDTPCAVYVSGMAAQSTTSPPVWVSEK